MKYLPDKYSDLDSFVGKINGDRWLPVRAHLLDTAGIMEHLVSLWISPSAARVICDNLDEILRLCVFIAMVHDIGKLTPLFAAKILSYCNNLFREDFCSGIVELPKLGNFLSKEKSPHARAGEAILLHLGCPPGIAAVVGAHHGKPENDDSALENQMGVYKRNYFGFAKDREFWEGIWKNCLDNALSEAGFGSLDELPDIGETSQVLLTGLLIMSDWIASNTSYFPLIDCDENMASPSLKYPDRVNAGWKRLNLPAPWSPCRFHMDKEDFTELFSFEPNAVQSSVMRAAEDSVSPGVFILEAPMGLGKTEAALGAAEILASKTGCGGIFFGLPTQATANGIFGRLVDWAKKQSKDAELGIRLAHGLAELNDDYKALFGGHARTEEDDNGGVVAHPWFDGRKQAMLADFVIGTVDQLLMAALRQKHVMMRHLGIAGKVVIIDECHAYDAYMSRYLDRVLNWLGAYRIPVIMLSATLPSKRRAEFVDAYLNRKSKNSSDDEWRGSEEYPLLTWTDGNDIRQQAIDKAGGSRSVSILRKGEDKWIDDLRDSLTNGGCAGIIVNTVKRAQQTARLLREKLPDKEVILIHSRFIVSDRLEREARITARLGKHGTDADRRGLIVVGTQVLEQSLDIDFDILVSDLCPMDLLLQRIGRLHRHDRHRPAGLENASCWVLGAQEDKSGSGSTVYDEYLLQRTLKCLPESIALPEDISPLVQKAYEDMTGKICDNDKKLSGLWKKYCENIEQKENEADNFRVPQPTLSAGGTIHGWLSDALGDNDALALSKVRDGSSSLDVLLMMRHDDGDSFAFMPWQHNGQKIQSGHMPSEEESRMIVRQRISLPRELCSPEETLRSVISYLENLNKRILPEWQRSGLLSGELVLPLDETLHAALNGYMLSYSLDDGLTINKIGDEKNEERI